MQSSIRESGSNQSLLRRLRLILNYGDRPWNGLLIIMALLILFVMLAVGILLWTDSSNARAQFGWNFLLPTTNASWSPVFDKFQSWPFIYGTLITSFAALVIAIPVSIGIAIFLAELSPEWLRLPLGWMVELLAAIPSVVYGLWGIFVFLPVVVTPVGGFLAESLGAIPGLGAFFTGPIPVSGASRLQRPCLSCLP